jgi:hypothetical protein
MIVWWTLWAAFFVGVFFYYKFLGRGLPAGPNHPDPADWQFGTIPVFVSAIIRWTILPRLTQPKSGLSAMLAGIALAEMTVFLGLFVFRQHPLELFVFGVLGILQFIPVYARRFAEAA